MRGKRKVQRKKRESNVNFKKDGHYSQKRTWAITRQGQKKK